MSDFDENPFINPAQAADASNEENFLADFDVSKLIRVFKKKLIYIILLFIICVAASWVVLRYTKRIYNASSTLKLEMKGTSELLGKGIFSSDENVANFLVGEIELILSRSIYEEAVAKLNLNVSYFIKGRWWFNYFERFQDSPFEITEYEIYNSAFYNRNLDIQIIDEEEFVLSYETPTGESFSKIYRFNTRIKNQYFTFIVSLTNTFDKLKSTSDSYFFTINSYEYQINYIASSIKANVVNPKAYTIQVSFTDNNPYKAAIITNTIVDIYFGKTLENKNKVYKQTINYLEDQVRIVQDSLERIEKGIDDYKQENGITNQNPEEYQGLVQNILDDIRDLQQERVDMDNELKLYREISTLLENDSTLLVALTYSTILTDATLKSRLEIVYEEEKEKKFMLDRVTKQTAAYQQKEKKIELLKKEVDKFITLNQRIIYEKLSQISISIYKLQSSIPSSASQIDLELKKMMRYQDSYQQNYSILLGKLIETSITMAGTVTNYQRLATAIPNTTPIYPESQLFYIYGLGAWLALSVLLIGLTYIRQNKVDSLAELEKLSSVPILGMVPKYNKPMDYSQLIIHRKPKSAISESFRSLRTNLDFMGNISNDTIISVTSTTSGEGKTFIAVNLGGIIALSQTKVVLLDLDLRKPKVHLAFGVENTRGMSTLLIGKTSIDEAINHSEIPNFDFITAGAQPPNPSELIMSDEFGLLLKQLKLRYDVIVFDMPPVGLVTDGIIAMRLADLPIYVVRTEYSQRSYVRGINRLHQVQNFKKLSIILNAATKSTGGGYGYGYGYDYGYGYYEDEDEKTTILGKAKIGWIKMKRKLSRK